MLKVELHTHTADDPVDLVPYTAIELIDRAAALDYRVLAITLHERQLDIRSLRSYAAERRIVLLPGIEQSIQGRHVLLINFSSDAEYVRTFDDLARLKRREAGLVIAPHPYFPSPSCLLGCLDRYAELFDAVEYNAMFTRSVNFNRRAERWADAHQKPIVGNCDVHRLHQLGTTYSLVEAEADPDAICAAIKAGRVQVRSRPLTWTRVWLHDDLAIHWGYFAVDTPCGTAYRPLAQRTHRTFNLRHLIIVNQGAVRQLIEQIAEGLMLWMLEVRLQSFQIVKLDHRCVRVILSHQFLVGATMRDAFADMKTLHRWDLTVRQHEERRT